MTDAKMRYVRVRCPFCGAVSPTVDQLAEPHRRGLADWWEDHKDWHMGGPRIEIAPAPEIQGYCGEGHPTEDIYDYGDDECHTVWAFAPYYSSESAGLPCGPIPKEAGKG